MNIVLKKYNIYKIKDLLPDRFAKVISEIFRGKAIYECMDGRIIDLKEK